MTSEEEDPFTKLVETLTVLENYNRALCLIAVYLGQRADQNTVQGITDIFSALLGKEATATPAKVRGLITSLVNVGILERERVKMISSTKVSFHSISPLGLIALLYVLIMYLIKDPMHGVEWENLMFVGYISSDREENLVRFLNNSIIESNRTTERFWTSLKSGKEPKKIRMSKPLDLDIIKTFSGKGGINTFKILEELMWDHLNLNTGLSQNEIASHFEGSITSNLNRLAPFALVEQLEKTKYYRLSSLGVLILPVFALMIKALSVDQSIFQSMLTKKVTSEDHPWIVLIRQARLFFKNLYQIP
ncbi:MAG: hypothetical protein JSW11_04095 [Candidatus Heimdallarchaeota archaeon]|nr:MAG: hypothetical protein JSW11_04095 [Candidatus Heimdallarchaeota archaeon]